MEMSEYKLRSEEMKMHWSKFLGIFLLLIGLLTSCMPPARARQRVAEVRRGIPDPPQAEILVEEISNASGSQDDCIGAEYTIVYGSQKAFNMIISAYRDKLLELDWEDISHEYVVPMFRKGENFFLAIIEVDVERATVFVGPEHRMTLEEAASQFQTLFIIGISFTTCPSG